MHPSHYNGWTSTVYPALVLERFLRAGVKGVTVEQVLSYADKAVFKDQTQGGSTQVWQHSIAYRCRGRVLAAQGELEAARAAFEVAESSAALRGYWMLQALALCDLKLHVLDPTGQGEHGSRRLGVVLRLLTGPAELLTPMLQGLDVAELMALPAPDASHASPNGTGSTVEEGVPPEGVAPKDSAPAAYLASTGRGRTLALLVMSPLFVGKRKCVANDVSTVRELIVCITEQVGVGVQEMPAAPELSVVVRDQDFDEDVVLTDLAQIDGNAARVTLVRAEADAS